MALHRAIHARPPPLLKRGPRRPPGREQPPPPPSRSGRPRGPSPSPRGPLGIRPRASTALQPLPPPGRSPRARPVSHAPAHALPGPGPRSPGAQPSPPPRYPSGGARPGPVRPRGDGVALPPPPPGFAPVDGARRDSSPPSGVRAPSPSAAPPSPAAPRAPRPTLASPGRAPATDGHTVTLGGRAHRPPSPRARAHTPLPRPPPPPLPAHAAPPSRSPPFLFASQVQRENQPRAVTSRQLRAPYRRRGSQAYSLTPAPPPPPRPQHARAAPAVLCSPHRNPRTPGPHQLCCAGPTGTPARQGRTSCAVQAPRETGSAPPRPRSCGSGARRQIAPSPVVGERRPEARGIGPRRSPNRWSLHPAPPPRLCHAQVGSLSPPQRGRAPG